MAGGVRRIVAAARRGWVRPFRGAPQAAGARVEGAAPLSRAAAAGGAVRRRRMGARTAPSPPLLSRTRRRTLDQPGPGKRPDWCVGGQLAALIGWKERGRGWPRPCSG